MRLLRRFAAVSLTCAATVMSLGMLLGITTAPAHAEEGFTYWGYYQLADSGWEFAQQGAAELTPEDGAVEGWRYATSPASGDTTRPPRTDLTFEEICADTEADDGEKRVGVVLDYGTADDAPDEAAAPDPVAECAVVPADATGQQTLGAVAEVRTEGGLNCAINGYPASGCGTPVADATVPDSEDPVEFAVPAAQPEGEQPGEDEGTESADADGLPWALIGVGTLVVVLVVASVLVARRRA